MNRNTNYNDDIWSECRYVKKNIAKILQANEM